MFEFTCICLALLAITVLLKHTAIRIFDAPMQETPQAILAAPTTTNIYAEFASFLERVAASSAETTANIDAEFASFLERVTASSAATSLAAISSMSATAVGELTSPECFAVIQDHRRQPKQKVNTSHRQRNRVISHTGRYNVRLRSNRAGNTTARQVVSEIVSEVDTLHAALHRLRHQCDSPGSARTNTDVDAVGSFQNSTSNQASSCVDAITIVSDTSVETITTIEDITTSQASASASGVAVHAVATVEAVSTVNAITTLDAVSSVAAVNGVKPITIFEAITTGNVFKIFTAVRAVDATKIVEASNTLNAITIGDSMNTAESVNCINAIKASKEFTRGIRGADKGPGAQDVVPLGFTMNSDAAEALADIHCHSIENTTQTINKDCDRVNVASDLGTLENSNDAATHRGESIGHVRKHMTTSQKVPTHAVQTMSSTMSVVSLPTNAITASLVSSQAITPRTVRNESISHTSNTPSVRADPATPPRTPPGVGFLDCGVQTEAPSLPIIPGNVRQECISDTSFRGANPLTPPSSPTLLGLVNAGDQIKDTAKHRLKSALTPQHTSGVINKLIELPNTRTLPGTPGATDDDVRMWGRGCSPAFNPNVHKAQMACDAFEEQWLNRRLGASIDKWQSSKWWTAEDRKARAFNWGMRRTINPEIKAHIYEIPKDIAFDVDDELDLPCGSSVCSSSDGGYSQGSADSGEEWERRRVEIKASLKVYEL